LVLSLSNSVCKVSLASVNSRCLSCVMSPKLRDVTALFKIPTAPLSRVSEQLDFVLSRSGCHDSVSVVRTRPVSEMRTS
jgi:hypothetical protein